MRLESIWPGKKHVGLKPGTYRYDGRGDLVGHRFHLRVDSRSRGVLMVDASKLIFLNGTALDFVRCYLEGRSVPDALRYMKHRYKKLDRAAVAKHYEQVQGQIRAYLHGEDNVIQTVGASGLSIGADELPAPYRMDLALTYRCQNDCGHCYNETKEKAELSPDKWKTIIDKLWEAGIPHVVFTGGEPTLYDHLDELVARSEEHGQITGLITNGRNLRQPGYVKKLVELGLDHVQITVLSSKEEVHDRLVCSKGAWAETIEGLKAAVAEDLYVSTNTTIMRANYDGVEETMRFLVSLGVKNIAFNSIIRSGKGERSEGIGFAELDSLLARLRRVADDAKVNLIWYSPTPYCEFDPVNNGLGIKQCTACSINMAVEPDGTVIPCQSYYQTLGNILTDPWLKIWKNQVCEDIRARKYLPEKCIDCKLVQVCGGGCPLSWKEGEYVCLDRHSSM